MVLQTVHVTQGHTQSELEHKLDAASSSQGTHCTDSINWKIFVYTSYSFPTAYTIPWLHVSEKLPGRSQSDKHGMAKE